MKHLLVLISLVSSSFISSLAFAGGGNTDSPSVQSLAYIGCSDPQFAKHLNPNRLSVSGSKSIATGARLPIGLVSQFTRPSAGGGGGFTDLVVESPNTFIGEFGNSSKAQIRIEFLPGSVARATIAEASSSRAMR